VNGLQVVASIGLLLGLLALAMALLRNRPAAAPDTTDTGSRQAIGADALVTGRSMSADAARDKVLILMDGHAFWPEILKTLNPSDDSDLNDMLLALRRHDPMTALTILNDELKVVLKTKPGALLEDALRRSKGDMAMEYQTRMGD